MIITEQAMDKQCKKVRDLLRRDGSITRLTAMHYGIANVTARIADLRLRYGYDIKCDIREDAEGNRYGTWSIKEPAAVKKLEAGARVRVVGSSYSSAIEGQTGVVVEVHKKAGFEAEFAEVFLDYPTSDFYADTAWNVDVEHLVVL